jgi:hypothetical protein
MYKIKLYEEFLAERSSGEIFNPKRNVPVNFDPKKYPELAKEFFDLISIAYAEIGGHAKIKSPADVFSDPDWNYWVGIDIHKTNDFDILIFGQKTKYGIKFSGVGHDGEKDSKKFYLETRAKDLQKLGYYIEVSGKLAEILINKYNVPQVTDEKEVEKVLGKDINWIGKKFGTSGDGWYSRKIGNEFHDKILVGRPRI